jgi:hypothetical protein
VVAAAAVLELAEELPFFLVNAGTMKRSAAAIAIRGRYLRVFGDTDTTLSS